MKGIAKDLGYGLRILRRNPGAALVAIVTLGLGIGAGTAIFSVVNAVLLKNLPYSQPQRLVMVWEKFLSFGLDKVPISASEYIDYRNESHVLEQTAAYGTVDFNLTGHELPERISGAEVTASLFPLLGVNPVLGRTFVNDENQQGRDGVAVISYGLWRRRFAADPNAVGQSILLNGRSHTVIGVMPRDFQFPMSLFGIKGVTFTQPAELWVPLVFTPGQLSHRSSRSYGLIGRLKAGEVLDSANTEVESIAARMQRRFPDNYPADGRGATAVLLKDQIVGEIRPVLIALAAGVALVLLIACANVANLLLARALSREKELAIRVALGASRWRIVRQLMAESAVLSILGGALGLLLAFLGVDVLVSYSAQTLPRVKDTTVDGQVLLFSLAVSILTAILFGLVPAIQASRTGLALSLKDRGQSSGSRSRQLLARAIVAGQFAIAVMLLIAAGLVIRSLWLLQNVNPGFDPKNVLTFELSLPREGFADRRGVSSFYQRVIERINAIPGVDAAGASSIMPLSGSNSDESFVVEGRIPRSLDDVGDVEYRIVTPGYFGALSVPLGSGRPFGPSDDEKSTPVTIINQALARRYFPDEDPIGKRVTTDDPRSPGAVWLTIIGVVGDVRHRGLAESPEPEMYVAHQQYPSRQMKLAVRTRSRPDSIATAVRDEIATFDRDLPIYNARTMERLVSESIAQQRLSTVLFGIFAAIALGLASIGIFGVISYSVTQRTHDIAIRRALGAERGEILRMVIGEGMILAAAGIGTGLGLALVLARGLSNCLFGVGYRDLPTFVGVPLLLAAVALLAIYLPARRATRVDPISALRYE